MSEILVQDTVNSLVMPDNIRIGLMVSEHRQKCQKQNCDFDYFGLAFGQSPFFVPETMQKSLCKFADRGHYSASDGIKELKKAVKGFNKRHFNINVSAERIVIGNGTKAIIYTLFSMLKGPVILPSPSWIGYRPQTKLLDKKTYILDLKLENKYKIDPDDLEDILKKADAKQSILVINNPHNPTGAVYSKEELEAIASVCKKYNTFVFADEIYALATYDFSKFISMANVYPEGTFVTNGISKDRSCGGWRLGHCILPERCDSKFRADFAKVAATVYTNVCTPVQFACIDAYNPSKEIEEYFKITREIHRIMGNFLSGEFNKVGGIKASVPEGGFYFYADFNELKSDLKRKGIKVSNNLADSLISHPYHIAVVTGDANMIDPDNFSARIASVDFDGKDVFDAYNNNPPKSAEEEIDFVKKNAPRMAGVRSALESWVKTIKK